MTNTTKKERILVVEGAADIASLLKIYFTVHGYEVLTAMRGQAALEICRETPPDIALLEINLSDMEGFDIGIALRSSPRTSHIPIVFLTKRGERQDRLRGLGEVRADYYIVKPFDIEEVHTIVKNLLDKQQRENLSHPITNLPTADLMHDQVSQTNTTRKQRILTVEDDHGILNLLKIYFTAHGYEVLTAMRGQAALEICRKTPINLALLDVNLPDMEGYDIGKELRASPRTRHIAIVFLTARGERSDRLKGLGEVRAQYYFVKPFDIEEVHTIIRNLLDAQRRRNLSHPVTHLPTAELIHDQVRQLLPLDGWALAMVQINGFDTFRQVYGDVVSEDILNFLAMLMNETLNELGDKNDFLGHMVVRQEFVMISTPDRTRAILDQLISRFDDEVGLHYNYKHRKQGYIEITDDDGNPCKIPLMSLSIGVITSQDGPFDDIRELWEEAQHTLKQAASDSSAHDHKSTAYYGRAPEKSETHKSGDTSIGVIDSVSLQTQTSDALTTLLAVSIECEPTDALALLEQNALTVPHAREINRLGSSDIVALVPTTYIDESIEQMLDHFYAHPKVQKREAVLSYGWASGAYESVDIWIEAVARDYLRQRREQMLDISNEPAILSLQPGRRELLQRYEQARALCETYREELMAQQGRYDQAVQTEIDRLTSIVNHDLNSGFMSLQRAVDDSAARLPTEAADALHFLHAVEEHILFCTAWRRSIIDLGTGNVVQRQELSPGPWLAKHLPILRRCMGGQVQLDIDLVNVPDAMVDKSLLLVACLHLLRAVDTAGASTLRVSMTPDQHEERFDILFTDDGDTDQRLASLAAYHPMQRAAFPWEYQNLTLLQRVLHIQDIEVRCEQHDAWFQMYWSIPRLTEPLAEPFLTLEELRSGVVALQQEAEHLEKAVSALDELEDDTNPEDAQALLLPFVEHLEYSLGAMREQFLPSAGCKNLYEKSAIGLRCSSLCHCEATDSKLASERMTTRLSRANFPPHEFLVRVFCPELAPGSQASLHCTAMSVTQVGCIS